MSIEYYPTPEITDLKDMLAKSRAKFGGDRAAFSFKIKGGGIENITYEEFSSQAEQLGTALLNLGLKGKHIAILSENRYEWIAAYLAIVCGAGVAVPVDKDLPAKSIEYILKAGDVSALLYSADYEDIIKNADLPKIETAISFDKAECESKKYRSYKKVIEYGRESLSKGDTCYINAKIDREAMTAILFTSGTTGFAKGVMLSHKNMVTVMRGSTAVSKYDDHNVLLSVLPYHHSFESVQSIMTSLMYGATTCINDSMKYFAKNLSVFKPDTLFSVPAIIGALHRRVAGKTKEEAQAIFGGNLYRVFSGSAPLKTELIDEFREWGVELSQGYGLTETSPTVTSACFRAMNEHNKASAGVVIPGCEVRIEEGEIQVKGDNVMLGYYNNPAATAEVMTDGWFKTGDLGYFDSDGFLYINGRSKNVIISEGGENVYPEEIEQALSEIAGIADVMVFGGENEAVTAIIYPDYETAFAGKTREEIKETLTAEVDRANETLPLYKHVVNVLIRRTPFEKTTTNKVKRNETNKEEK